MMCNVTGSKGFAVVFDGLEVICRGCTAPKYFIYRAYEYLARSAAVCLADYALLFHLFYKPSGAAVTDAQAALK
jgi:hypothetical protein